MAFVYLLIITLKANGQLCMAHAWRTHATWAKMYIVQVWAINSPKSTIYIWPPFCHSLFNLNNKILFYPYIAFHQGKLIFVMPPYFDLTRRNISDLFMASIWSWRYVPTLVHGGFFLLLPALHWVSRKLLFYGHPYFYPNRRNIVEEPPILMP